MFPKNVCMWISAAIIGSLICLRNTAASGIKFGARILIICFLSISFLTMLYGTASINLAG